MFNRYMRDYPWYLQLLIFVGLIFSIASLFSFGIGPVVLNKFYGVSLADVAKLDKDSPVSLVRAALWFQALSHIGIFSIPCLVFAYITHPRPMEYLGLRPAGKPVQWLWVVLAIVGALPVLLEFQQLLRNLPLGQGAREMQEQTDKMQQAFLNLHSMPDLIGTFVVLAILPAFGEELLFRSVLMRFAHKRGTSHAHQVLRFDFGTMALKKARMTFPIIVTSVLFAMAHGSVYGMPSIFLAGVLLAVIFFLTGSLWCSMLAHCINNGSQIIMMYAFRNNAQWKAIIDNDTLPWYLPVAGAAICAFALYMLWKDRTPLAPNWSADFTLEELQGMASEK